MQAYQILDAESLAHRLAKRLEKRFQRPYALPAAVGGFGVLQEHMLYEDYCRSRKPAVIIHHWA